MNKINISNKKFHVLIYTILSVLLVAALVWGIFYFNNARKYKLSLTNNYNRAFSELVGYVDDIETLLNKSMLVSSASQMATISSDIFRQSASAKACLGQLPTSQINLDNTAKFLSQVGDYTYVLSQSVINGDKISQEAYDNLSSLTQYATELNNSLLSIQEQIYSGNIDYFSEPKSSSSVVNAEGNIYTDLENVEKSFEEYPALIYDGPFSEHIENRESPLLKNSNNISMDQAKEAAVKFLDNNVSGLVFEGDTQNTPIDAYSFTSKTDSNEISISITKKGGYVLYFLNNRKVEKENLDFSQAIKYASDYLQKHGYTSMTNSYYDKLSGIATINFAYVQDGIKCYSDLIKVRVALDNGEILGIETNGYLMNHSNRDFGTPKLTQQEARAKINTHLDIQSSNLALIPKDSLEEVLCYEFRGQFNGKNFIIYINASNGREEKILMLLESEDGILTV